MHNANMLFACGGQALAYYVALKAVPSRNAPDLWTKLALCWWQLGRPDCVADVYCDVLAGLPAISFSLSELHMEICYFKPR